MPIKNNDDIAHLLDATGRPGAPYREFEGPSDHISAPLIDAVFAKAPPVPAPEPQQPLPIHSAPSGSDLLSDVFDTPRVAPPPVYAAPPLPVPPAYPAAYAAPVHPSAVNPTPVHSAPVHPAAAHPPAGYPPAAYPLAAYSPTSAPEAARTAVAPGSPLPAPAAPPAPFAGGLPVPPPAAGGPPGRSLRDLRRIITQRVEEVPPARPSDGLNGLFDRLAG